jgi:hypothetical protein
MRTFHLIPFLVLSLFFSSCDDCDSCQSAVNHMYENIGSFNCSPGPMDNAREQIIEDCKEYDGNYIIGCIVEDCFDGRSTPQLCPVFGTAIETKLTIRYENDQSWSPDDVNMHVRVLNSSGGVRSEETYVVNGYVTQFYDVLVNDEDVIQIEFEDMTSDLVYGTFENVYSVVWGSGVWRTQARYLLVEDDMAGDTFSATFSNW